MKFLWRLVFLIGLFFSLYFFGNFRINEVNVRDYLQSKITLQQMKDFGRRTADFFDMLAGLIRNKSAELGDGKTGPVSGNPLSGDVSMEDAKKLIGDTLSEEDRKKILKIFEQNLNPGEPDKSTGTGKKDH